MGPQDQHTIKGLKLLKIGLQICSIKNSLSLSLCPFSRWTWVSRYQNVSTEDFIGAKDEGSDGDDWSYKSCKAPVKSSQPTPSFIQAGCPSCCLANSVKSTEGKV